MSRQSETDCFQAVERVSAAFLPPTLRKDSQKQMDEIRVMIADDEPGMQLIERKMIEKVDGFVLVGVADNGNELLQLVEEHRPQIVFLDVEMPGKTGVECARQIQDMDPSIILIFATAHDQYMGDAFEVYAFDYLIQGGSGDADAPAGP